MTTLKEKFITAYRAKSNDILADTFEELDYSGEFDDYPSSEVLDTVSEWVDPYAEGDDYEALRRALNDANREACRRARLF